MDDRQLLQDYVGRNSETAFRALVSRYVNLVYAVALRQVRDLHLAEEVAQAVFILLARKARGFRSGIVLSGWLFRTTRFVASRAIRAETRRLRREQEAFAMQQLATADDTWKRMAPTIDEALESLGETDRNAVLLRFFNEKSLRETGAALGVSEDAAKKRVTRAVEKLRGFFVARGFVLSAAVIGPALAGNAAKAAPAGLANAATVAALAGGTAATATLPAIVGETLAAWRQARIKLAAGLAVVVFVAAFVAHRATVQRSGAELTARANESSAASSATSLPDPVGGLPGLAPAALAAANANDTLLFSVLDAQTGSGVPGVRVAVSYVRKTKWWDGDDQITDADGMCSIPIPTELGRLDIGALKDGYVQKFYTWRRDQGEPLPLVYNLRLERGVTIGGRVNDESGQAVAGAEIAVHFPEVGDSSSREPKPVRLGFLRDLTAARTDAQGRWNCAIVPAGYGDFHLEVRHPQYATATFNTDGDARSYGNPQRLAMTDLWATNAIMLLRPGFQISGVVLDDADRPVAEAKVSLFIGSAFERVSTTTGIEGAFSLGGLDAGDARVGASAEGFAPVSQAIHVPPNATNVILRLARGTAVSLRVVDEEGNGIAGAWVVVEGPQRNTADWRATTDAEGRVQIQGIPDDVRDNLRFTGMAEGFFFSRDVRVDLSAPEPTIQLRRALKVSGQVVDAKSGQPIESFKAIPCSGESIGGYYRSERKLGTNGGFTLTFNEFQPPFRVRIEADGYEPAMSSPIRVSPREQSVEMKLQRKDPSRAIHGTVLSADGQPVAGADIALLTFERGANLGRARFIERGNQTLLTRTDDAGRFQFDPDESAHTVMAVHKSGFGKARVRLPGENVLVRLSPCGKIEGHVRTRDGKWSGRDVVLSMPHSEAGLWLDHTSYSIPSDAEGRFSLDCIPAGTYTLYLNPGVGKSYTDATFVEVPAGETVEAQIGGIGALLTGRLQFDGKPVDWLAQIKMAFLSPGSSPPPFQAPPPTANFEERRKRLDLVESDAWQEWARTQRPGATLKIATDGSFVAEGVRAGEYELCVDLAATGVESPMNPRESFSRPTAASIRQSVTVSETQEQAGETIDLGVLTLRLKAREAR